MQEVLAKLETLDLETIGTDLRVVRRRRTVYRRTTPASSSPPSPSSTWLSSWPRPRVLEQGPQRLTSRSLSSSSWRTFCLSLSHRRQLRGVGALHQDERILFSKITFRSYLPRGWSESKDNRHWKSAARVLARGGVPMLDELDLVASRALHRATPTAAKTP